MTIEGATHDYIEEAIAAAQDRRCALRRQRSYMTQVYQTITKDYGIRTQRVLRH